MTELGNWPKVLENWVGDDKLFAPDFIAKFDSQIWEPSSADIQAAGYLHVELMSRISTQPLGYSEGTEDRALQSIFSLFGKSRQLSAVQGLDGTFENLVWYVLNTHVRPFTAKWHLKGSAGALHALDATDIFRADLLAVQERLIALDGVLVLMAGGTRVAVTKAAPVKHALIETEIGRHKPIWRPAGVRKDFALPNGASPGSEESVLRDAEHGMVAERRKTYKIEGADTWACGIALSGGGIRSATFAMGVLASLARRNLLPQFDYLSTVSGGGYAGSFLTQLLGQTAVAPDHGLGRDQLPFRRDEGESRLLQKVRNNASYLSGSLWERVFLAIFQAQGIYINLLLLSLATLVVAALDLAMESLIGAAVFDVAWASVGALSILFLATAVIRGYGPGLTAVTGILGLICLLPVLFVLVQHIHDLVADLFGEPMGDTGIRTPFALYFISLLLVVVIGIVFSRRPKMRPVLIATLTILFLIGLELAAYRILGSISYEMSFDHIVAAILIVTILTAFLSALNVNATSLNAYYRTKLSKAFLLRADGDPADVSKLSSFKPTKASFPIINCALNLPGSERSRMRGRRSDLLSFTPVACGARVLGYHPMSAWEDLNPQFDLSMAMALSGAAVSPQMGLNTTKYASFWLTLLNLRLNAWLRQPIKSRWPSLKHPTALQLVKEAMATNSEKDAHVNVSDGGHIENLGVYELLRRRCRFIVAVDGEEDASMTFHGLTNLQRLAYIDMGITIEIDLDDLRLSEKGLSRSHFRFCRIRYPDGSTSKGHEIGYLIYLKLSLTGNEGEFIRRYKFDDPAFPHNSTSNQFFTEVQFEAYRELGEHVGDKMFLKALTNFDDCNDIKMEDWFIGLAKSFLDPLDVQASKDNLVSPECGL